MSVIVFGCPNTHQSIWSTSIPTFEMLCLKTKKIDIYCSRWRLYFSRHGWSEDSEASQNNRRYQSSNSRCLRLTDVGSDVEMTTVIKKTKKTFYRLAEEIQLIFIDINAVAVTVMIGLRLFKQK